MTVVYIDDVRFKHCLSAATLSQAQQLISNSRAATNLRTTALGAAIKSGDHAAQIEARQWLMTSPEALLVSAIDANKKLPYVKRWTLDKCLAIPKLLDLSKPLAEPVPVHPQKKKSGGSG
jgi:hypothetical protein